MRAHIAGLVVKIVELCNLNCTYCYMYNHVDQSYRRRPKFMSEDVFRQLVARVDEYVTASRSGHMSITLHGGEPMLMPPARLRRFVELARERLGDAVSFGMQTNATLVTEEWISVLADHKIGVGISLDGPPELHDASRVYHDGRGSYQATLAGLRMMQEAQLRPTPSALCVITPGRDGLTIYKHLRQLGLRRMNFLLPEVSHDTAPAWDRDVTSTPVADYLIPIFDDWFAEDDPRVSIRLFSSIIRVLLGGASNTESIGGGPVNYLVIDTDGSVHGNDCLKVCEHGMSDSGLNLRSHSFDDLRTGLPLVYQLTCEGLPTATACVGCPELATCGGGSAPQRYSRERGFDNASVWCRDLKKLIAHIRGAIESHVHTSVAEPGGLLHQRHRGQHPQPSGA